MRSALIFLSILLSASAGAQKVQWIPFHWDRTKIGDRYLEKTAILVPVLIDGLPYQFNMQHDLGAPTTVIYGNSIAPYLDRHKQLKNKLDSSLTFYIESKKNIKFKNVSLRMGNVLLNNIDIGYFENYGDKIQIDSVDARTEKHIGTIGADIFQNKILIIDYIRQRFAIVEKIPKRFMKAEFLPFDIKDGRIKILLTINGKQEPVLFDTGASQALFTTEERAKPIAAVHITDSVNASSWGKKISFYGSEITSGIYFGKKCLAPALVWYDRQQMFDGFYRREKIWGTAGNAYFHNNIVIIDYKRKRFGVK